MNNATLHQIVYEDLDRIYYKISVNDIIKGADVKIEQNKAQYSLDIQTTKISALSLGNVGKVEILIGKDILLENQLLEKAAAIKNLNTHH